MLNGFEEEYIAHASVYADSTNVFMQYYRQAGIGVMKKAWKEAGNDDVVFFSIPYEDITAALDYYFEHYNNGRPFIIAGHSQGQPLLSSYSKNISKNTPIITSA